MSRRERDKGARGEREVAAIFRALEIVADRTPNSGGLNVPGDLQTPTHPALHIEVKRQEQIRMPEWLAQARSEAPPGHVPIVAFRRSGETWSAVVPLEWLVGLL